MVATTSHNHRSKAEDRTEESNQLNPGAKVMLFGLLRCTLTYKDHCWPDQSRLNGSLGYILRRENDFWIVELELDNAVSLTDACTEHRLYIFVQQEIPVNARHLRCVKSSLKLCKCEDIIASHFGDKRNLVHASGNDASRILAPRLQGVLHKRGYWNATWNPYYFVQTACGELEYFKVEDRGEAIGMIPIAMQAGCTGSDSETVVRSKGREAGLYLLEVEAKGAGPANRGRTFVLGAESYAERDHWVASLRIVAEAWRHTNAAQSVGRPRRASTSSTRSQSPETLSATSHCSTPEPRLPVAGGCWGWANDSETKAVNEAVLDGGRWAKEVNMQATPGPRSGRTPVLGAPTRTLAAPPRGLVGAFRRAAGAAVSRPAPGAGAAGRTKSPGEGVAAAPVGDVRRLGLGTLNAPAPDRRRAHSLDSDGHPAGAGQSLESLEAPVRGRCSSESGCGRASSSALPPSGRGNCLLRRLSESNWR